MKLHTIICSTRPGRVGPAVATWFHGVAAQHGRFETRLVDLAEVNLPFLDEAAHPKLQKYEHEHTRRWSAIVDAADAFVFVTPEYNYGMPASLVNAIDFLWKEWSYKPCGLVSYGGVSGGTRSAQMAKLKLTAVRMMPLFEQVTIPSVTQYLSEDKKTFNAQENHVKSANGMLDELVKWATALRGMRA